MNRTNIPWLRSETGVRGYTWNPITGCTHGCTYCWARKRAEGGLRGKFGYPEDDPFQVIFRPERLSQLSKVKKPSKVFICSMGDLFGVGVDDSWIDEIAMAMNNAKWHKYYALTKSTARMNTMLKTSRLLQFMRTREQLWLGISAEYQALFDDRINYLVDIPGKEKFLSLEPLLGHIDLGCRLTSTSGIEMIIVGCDSRPAGVRLEAKVEWFRSLWRQCEERGIKFMLKQIVVDGKMIKATTCDGLDPRILEG